MEETDPEKIKRLDAPRNDLPSDGLAVKQD
jgi:hypothetical protein